MKKITVSLIAEKAQVSPATVSRVLNHRELVKEPTIRRVEEAMRSLGCQIENTVTVSKETQPLIVLNIPGIENVFYQEIIQKRVSAKAHGCHLLIHESHLNKGNLLDFCNLLRRVDAAGVILLNRVSEEGLNQIRVIARWYSAVNIMTMRITHMSVLMTPELQNLQRNIFCQMEEVRSR